MSISIHTVVRWSPWFVLVCCALTMTRLEATVSGWDSSISIPSGHPMGGGGYNGGGGGGYGGGGGGGGGVVWGNGSWAQQQPPEPVYSFDSSDHDRTQVAHDSTQSGDEAYKRGFAAYKAKNYHDAELAFREVLRLQHMAEQLGVDVSRKLAAASIALALCLHEEAIQRLEHHYPTLAESLEQDHAAQIELAEALKLDPGNPQYIQTWRIGSAIGAEDSGRQALQDGHYDDAIALFRQEFAASQEAMAAVKALAAANAGPNAPVYRCGSTVADVGMSEAYTLTTNALLAKAQSLAQQGKVAAAVATVESVHELNPSDPAVTEWFKWTAAVPVSALGGPRAASAPGSDIKAGDQLVAAGAIATAKGDEAPVYNGGATKTGSLNYGATPAVDVAHLTDAQQHNPKIMSQVIALDALSSRKEQLDRERTALKEAFTTAPEAKKQEIIAQLDKNTKSTNATAFEQFEKKEELKRIVADANALDNLPGLSSSPAPASPATPGK